MTEKNRFFFQFDTTNFTKKCESLKWIEIFFICSRFERMLQKSS